MIKSYWSTYIIIILLIVMGALFAYYTMVNNTKLAEVSKQQTEKSIASVVENEIEVVDTKAENIAVSTSSERVGQEDDWKKIYPITQDLQIRDVQVQASVARTWADRIKGLSDTPYLPEKVVKLFVFDSLGEHSIWMKDMNYAIDIIWVDADNKIVDIKKNATPESFPEAFIPKKDALYVIETKVGFVDKFSIKIGDEVIVPKEE